MSPTMRKQLSPAEKAARFPAEMKPNPDYQYEPPREVIINGVRCIEVDAGFYQWMRDTSERHSHQKPPKLPK